MRSVTVGRKFNRTRCERALCCRLQRFTPDTVPALKGTPFGIRHVALLCSAVKLDNGAIATGGEEVGQGAHAQFASSAFTWSEGDEALSLHEGLTGLQVCARVLVIEFHSLATVNCHYSPLKCGRFSLKRRTPPRRTGAALL